MELYQLNSFVTVAQTSNLTRAAQRLNTTPPSVSSHIKQLENELGIDLFTRTAKGMLITSQGERLLEQVKKGLGAIDEIKTLADLLKSNISGNLSLAINAGHEFLKIPELIDLVISDYPDIKLEIVPSSTHMILDSIKQETIDCGFASGPIEETGVEALYLSTVKLLIGVPSKFENRYHQSSLADLIHLPWVVPENRCPFLKVVTDHLHKNGLELSNPVFANDDITKLTLVKKGVAVCVLEESEAKPFLKNKEIFPWEGSQRFNSMVSFVYPTRRGKDQLIETMVSMIKEVWDL